MDSDIIAWVIAISVFSFAIYAELFRLKKEEKQMKEDAEKKGIGTSGLRICFRLPDQFKRRAIDMGLFELDLRDLTIDDIEELIISKETEHRIDSVAWVDSKIDDLTIADYERYKLNPKASRKALREYFKTDYTRTAWETIEENRRHYATVTATVKP